MIDISKVKMGLECCTNGENNTPKCEKCPYADEQGTCEKLDELHRDALELLNGREFVKPVFVGNDEWQCPECEAVVGWTELECGGITETKYKYCPECGRRIAWE